MKKKWIAIAVFVVALFALMLLDIVPGLTAQAATGETTGDIGFYVQAVLPQNQIDQSLTYFDLRVQPGQTQQLAVEVVNESATAITVDVAAISASTNRNGIIDYKTPDVKDKTLLNPFSEIATLENDSLSIPAHSKATVHVTLRLPADKFDGVVLGGLVFTRQPDEQTAAADGMLLQNVYSYVIGVKLSETDTTVVPGYEVESVQAETVNYLPAMVHYIRNKEAAIAKNVNLHVTVRNSAGEVVAEVEKLGVDMAPNSVMPLAVTPQSGSGNGSVAGDGNLLPGDYTSEITLEQGGESWVFEQKFTIGSVQADAINSEAIGIVPAQNTGVQPSVLLIVLLVAGVLILGMLIIILLMLRRSKEAKELNRLMRQRRQNLRLQQEMKKRRLEEDSPF